MRRFLLSVWVCLCLGVHTIYSQDKSTEWYITANTNLYYPIQTPSKGVYPVLWYDKEADPSVLIGGFGIGGAVYHSLTEKFAVKGQLNVSKHSYWNEPVEVVDQNGNVYFSFIPSSVDYMAGLSATSNYFFTPKFGLGTGLGTQYLIVSLTRQPEAFGDVVRNHYYRPFVATVPIEATLKLSNTALTVRYEHSFSNRLRAKSNYTDKFGLVYFEVGFKIR